MALKRINKVCVCVCVRVFFRWATAVLIKGALRLVWSLVGCECVWVGICIHTRERESECIFHRRSYLLCTSQEREREIREIDETSRGETRRETNVCCQSNSVIYFFIAIVKWIMNGAMKGNRWGGGFPFWQPNEIFFWKYSRSYCIGVRRMCLYCFLRTRTHTQIHSLSLSLAVRV